MREECVITSGANAGVSIRWGDFCIWIDVLHAEQTKDYESLTPEAARGILQEGALGSPDVIFFTHCHPDHYSRALCFAAAKQFPDARFALPEEELPGQTVLRGPEQLLCAKERYLRFVRLPHEGMEYREVPHYGLLIEEEDGCLFVAGDAALCAPEIVTALHGHTIDVAILPFAWTLTFAACDFLKRQIAPRHLLLNHLPPETRDPQDFRKKTLATVPNLSEIPDIRVMLHPFQKEVFQAL